jgi:hypothetical protein
LGDFLDKELLETGLDLVAALGGISKFDFERVKELEA